MRDVSNECFQRALLAVTGRSGRIGQMKLNSETKVAVDVEYRKNLCALPTKILELTVLAHHKGVMRRQGVTLHAIKTEIAERILLGEDNDPKTEKASTKKALQNK